MNNVSIVDMRFGIFASFEYGKMRRTWYMYRLRTLHRLHDETSVYFVYLLVPVNLQATNLPLWHTTSHGGRVSYIVMLLTISVC